MKSEVFSRLRRASLLGGLVLGLLAGAGAAPSPTPTPRPSPTPAAPASPAPTPAPTATPTPTPALALAEIAPQAQDTLAKLKNFEPEGSPDPAVEAVQNSLLDLRKDIDELRDRAVKAAENIGSSLDTLRSQQLIWHKFEETLTDHSKALGDRGRALEDEARQVEKIHAEWTAKRDALGAQDSNVPPETRDQVSTVIYNALTAQTRVKVRQNRVLELQSRVGELLSRVDAGQAIVDQALAAARKTLFVRESPPLWARDAQPAPDLPGRWRASYDEQTAQFREFLDDHATLFVVHFAVFLALAGLFLWLRRIVHA